MAEKREPLVKIYDTTLRDGTQAEGVQFSVKDKVRITLKLDEFGMDYVEGGWPGSNPTDVQFFSAMRKQTLHHAKLAAFGSTRRARVKAYEDHNLLELVKSHAPVATIFGKSWLLHVEKALRVSAEENLEMIADSVAFLKSEGREVIYDAEHFFDGYRDNAEYAIKTLLAAQQAGADCLALCDTNGGSLPAQLQAAIKDVKKHVRIPIGIHVHNDSDLAVGNSLVAVREGAVQVQGTINGYGERCGNANLCSILPNLKLKMGYNFQAATHLDKLTELSMFVSEVGNLVPDDRQPFVGRSAFAHKGGIHVSAVQRESSTYEHIHPTAVGNQQRVIISELSGRSNIEYQAEALHLEQPLGKEDTLKVLNEIKERESHGYSYETANGSLELLIRRVLGTYQQHISFKKFRVTVEREPRGRIYSEATIRGKVDVKELFLAADGDGPVNALDNALRKGIAECGLIPNLDEVRLTDYKVRVLDAKEGTGAKVRVLVETRDLYSEWVTVGVSENIIEASWEALIEAYEVKIHRDMERK